MSSFPSDADQTSKVGGFSGMCIACIVLAGLSLIASFSQPTSLVAVALFGGFAYYLYNGGRDFTKDMPSGGTRTRAWMVWGFIAGMALITGFTWPPALIVAVLAGGYAAYLFTGGRDVTREGRDGIRRSIVWLYYVALAGLFTVLGFSHPAALLAALVAACYATYLYRGGRFVIWFW